MKAWEELLISLEATLGKAAVAQWLRPIKILRFDAANIYLEATPFQKAWFEEHVRGRIPFHNNNHRPIRIHFEISSRPSSKLSSSHRRSVDEALSSSRFQMVPAPLEKEFQLDSFLPTPPHAVALQMALDLSTNEHPSFNPVFYFGPTGSGKTHLLMGIAHAMKNKGRNVLFTTAESFTGYVVNAIRLGKMQEFRQKIREIDALIVEDIHLFSRRNSTQEEFFHTFNQLHTAGRQVILSANEPSKHLQEIEPRLISRFEWGISLKLDPPDKALLTRILEKKASLLDLSPPPELIAFLLNRFTSSVKAPIVALHALALRAPKLFDPLKAEIVLADLLEKERTALLTPEKIIKQTAAYFGIRIEDLIGKSQMREFVQPRQIAMYFCRTLLHMPFQKIGELFKRDHSTVMTSIRAASTKSSLFNEALKYLTKKFIRS